MRKKKPTVLSFFTGAGGLDLGFRSSGFDVACSVELEQWACDTLRLNHPGTCVIGPPNHSGNVKKLTTEDIYSLAKIEPGSIDVIIGGPPCQPFSVAASQRFLSDDKRFKRKGFKDSIKGTLLFDFIKFIEEIKPRAFLLENVPGLLTLDNGKQLTKALEILKDAGYYHSTPTVIDAVEYGVPQFRKRLIVWGSRNVQKPVLPEPSHSANCDLFRRPYNKVVHALAGMPQDLPNHTTRDHADASVARYKTLLFGQREKLGRVDRLNPFEPSKTVIAGGSNGGGRSHLHPFIARTLTVRESARLQTFPDTYVFAGAIARQFTQVGNAVPPLLAEHLARQIFHQEFKKVLTEAFYHGTYMEKAQTEVALVEQLLRESISQNTEWLYSSLSVNKPLRAKRDSRLEFAFN